jgi:hypothetical protein
MGMRFGTKNVRSLYRSGSFKTLAKESFDLIGVMKVRGNKGGTQQADDYELFYGNENANRHFRSHFFIYIRESYQQLSG